ncbi:MAG: hypothetical protein U5N56_08540 [Candidatus Marinimicrobia bacterium]|nr:hypothetical protein [Candidatus Neomarinimicrobiota bacterium]
MGYACGGSAVLPAGDLSAWFGKGFSAEISAGRQHNTSWYIEGVADYSLFRNQHPVTDNDGNIHQNISLSLWYAGFMVQGKYILAQRPLFRPYVSIVAGPHYWRGIRGSVSENEALAIPDIAEKVLNEWNMGFRTGTGTEVLLTENLVLDTGIAYRLVVGALWPVMQEHIELEAVNGFQTAAFYLRLKMYF